MEFEFNNSFNITYEHHQKEIMRKHLNDPKYKTELCKNYLKFGFCTYKGKCRYAHGEDELVSKNISNKNYKRKRCHKFNNSGFCPYGERCQFIHFDKTIREITSFESNFYQMLLISKFYDPGLLVETNNFTLKTTTQMNLNSFKINLKLPLKNAKRKNQNGILSGVNNSLGKRLAIFKEITRQSKNKCINKNINNYEKIHHCDNIPFAINKGVLEGQLLEKFSRAYTNFYNTPNKKN